MTGYTVHTGSNEKFSSGWDSIFASKKAGKKKAAKKKAAKKATAKKSSKKASKKKKS